MAFGKSATIPPAWPLEDYRLMKETISFPANVGLVSIRFDDNDYTVYQNAYPLLKARGLPATMSFVANRVGAFPTRTKCTDAQIDEMARSGFELASHTYTHLARPTALTDMLREVAQSRLDWESSLGFAVRNLCAPGTWNTPLPVRDTALGQFLMDHYTFFEGDATHPIPNRPLNDRYSINHQTGDNQTAATIKGWIDQVAGVPKSLIIMFHSIGDIVTGEGGVTYGVSNAVFTEVCDYLATLRSQGSIEVLTDSGVMGASVGDAKNLIYNGGFETLNGSSMPTGWTVSGAPALVTINPHGGVNAMSTTSANYLSLFLSCYGLRSPVYRLSAWHRTDTAGTARMMATVPNGLRTWTAASAGAWQKIEGCFSIPLGAERFGLLLQPSAGTVIWDDVKVERIG